MLQYVYAFFAALGLLTLSLGIYCLVAPEKFKEELNIRNGDARTEQVEGAQPGEGALNDILDGIMDVFSVDSEDRKGEADATPDEEENATAPAAEQPERQ